MIEVKDMTIDDLEQFIEQKLLEVLGDPDSGLHLREDYKTMLKERLKKGLNSYLMRSINSKKEV